MLTPTSGSGRARHAWLALTLLAVLAFSGDLLVPGNNLYVRDIARNYVPERGAVATALREGGLPYWNPFAGGGQPLAANPGYAAFYPPQWTLLFLSPARSFNLQIVSHLLLAAAGAFALLASFGALPPACALAGLTYALGGTMLSASNLTPVLLSLAWFPWVVFFARRLFASHRLRDFALASLSLGMLLLIADQAMILQCGALVGVVAVEYAWRCRSRAKLTLILAVLIVMAASLVGAVQIIPALDLKRDSGRATGLRMEEVMTWSMPPYRPLELVFPGAFSSLDAGGNMYFWARARFDRAMRLPWIFSFYPGLLAGILIVSGFRRRTPGWRLTAFVATISFFFALGSRGGIFPLLYAVGVRSIRYPEKFFLPAIFALTIFAARTADAALKDSSVRRTVGRVAAGVAMIYATTLIFTVAWPGADRLFVSVFGLEPEAAGLLGIFRAAWTRDTLIAALLCIPLLAERLKPALRMSLLFTIVLVDLGIRVPSLMPRIEPHYYDDPPVAKWLQAERPLARLYNEADWARYRTPQPAVAPELRQWVIRNGLLPSTQQLRHIPGILEIDVARMYLRPTLEFSQAHSIVSSRRPDQSITLMEMAGVTHIATLSEIPPEVRFEPALYETVAPVEIRRTRLPGRYYFASRIRPLATQGEFVNALLHEPALQRREVFTDVPAFTPAAGVIHAIQERCDDIQMNVETPGPALLTIAVTRHKYWSATVDGQTAMLHPANLAFQSLVIPPGRHRVELRYRNPLVALSAIVSAATSLLFILCALRSPSLAASPRSREPQQPSPH